MISFLTILSILFIFPHISNAFVHYGRGYYHSVVNVNAKILNNSKYITPYRNAMASWNSATSRIRWGNANASSNLIYVSGWANVNWFGEYKGFGSSSNGRATRFTIKINDNNIPGDNRFRQSVIAHEMGHALCLNHTTHHPSIMNSNRNRRMIITPFSDDIRGVNYAY